MRVRRLMRTESGTGSSEDRPVSTRSLRHRVVFSVLALLLIVLLGLGLAVNTILKNRLVSDLDQRLRDRAGLAVALTEQGLTGQPLSNRIDGAGIRSRVTDSSGVFYGQAQPGVVGPPAGPAGPKPRPARPTPDVAVTKDGPNLVATVNIGTGANARVVTLTASRVEIDRTLSTLRNIELVAGAATLLVVALLLWRVVGVALAPLDRMTALARRIRDGARGRRLRPTRPDTEIGRTATAFDAMLDSLETAEASAQRAEADAQRAEARMRQFLADASHDLRTPLAGVITTAEGVLREDPDRLLREQRLVALIREARRAARLVDDLLLMTRLENGSDMSSAPSGPPADVVAILRASAEQAAQREPLRRVVVDTPDADTPLPVAADADSLHRVLGNLIDNARRATPADGTITLALRNGGDAVEIDVCDDGSGIPADQRERIFDRFVRLADPRDGRPADGGHGLGLPIARGLVRLYGGELSLVDDDGSRGAVFRIRLPLRTTAVTGKPAPSWVPAAELATSGR